MGLSVEQPQRWRLALHIDGTALSAVCLPVTAEGDPAMLHMPLADASVEALEEAVYATPGLLDDFGKVDVLVNTPDYTVVPASIDGEAAAALMGLDAEEAVLHRTDIGECTAAAMWSLPAPVHHFLARTFRNPAMRHPAAVLTRYFAAGAAGGNGMRVFVNFNAPGSLDIIALDTGARLRLLCSKVAPTDSDALYFIFGALESTGFDHKADRLLLCGDRRRRQALAPLLRRYVRTVLPVLPPAGTAPAFADNIPYSLTVLPLCE